MMSGEGKEWVMYGCWESGFGGVEVDGCRGKRKVELGKGFGRGEEIGG